MPGSLRGLLAFGVVLAFCFSNIAEIAAQSVPVYGLFQGHEFIQVGDFIFTSNPSRPAYCEFWAWGLGPDEFNAAQVRTPNGNVFELPLGGEGGGVSGQDYLTAGERSLDFPAGSYSFEFIRADDSIFSVDLTQDAPAYPGTPKLLNLLLLKPKAGVDLKLDLQPAADARADDFLMVMVQALNAKNGTSWLYQTPWPGQSGALSGFVRSATVPGYLLQPNDTMMVKIITYRATYVQALPNHSGLALAGSTVGVFTTLSVPDEPQDSDVLRYRLLSSRIFAQTGQSSPIATTNSGFEFEPSAWARSRNRLTNVTVSLPSSVSLSLEPDENNMLWQTNLVFNREDELLLAAPIGTYKWIFDGVAKGRQIANLMLSSDIWPEPLPVANWMTLQTNSFTNDFFLRWALPAGAGASDQVELTIVDPAQNVIFRYPDYASGDTPVPGIQSQMTIPAGTLTSGEDYQARLRLIHILQQNTQALTGATGIVARCAETRFTIGSRVAFPLEIVPEPQPVGGVGLEYSNQLQARGGRRPWTWSVTQGDLPGGLRLDSSGRIEGIPYANGIFGVTVQVTDLLGNNAVQSLSFAIDGMLAPLAITTTNLSDLSDGFYSLRLLSAAGGAAPLLWSISSGELPPGLHLQRESGVISGIAEEAGAYSFEAKVEDASGQIQRRLLALNVPSATNNPPLRLTQLTIPARTASASRFNDSAERKFRLHLNADPNELVTVEVSSNLTEWQILFSTNMATDGVLEWIYPQTGNGFYRVRRGIPEPQYNPVTINVTLDTESSAVAILTAAGTSLSLTNSAGVIWHLEVPTNAVVDATAISMTLVQSANGFPFEVGFLGGVSFAPDGLTLLAPATLTATFPNNLPEDTVGFGFEENGGDFHLYPSRVTSNVMTFPINHFSGAMGGTASAANTGSMIDQNMACSSTSSHEAQLARLIDSGADRQELWNYFVTWAGNTIDPNLKAAAENDELLWSTSQEFQSWVFLMDKYLLAGREGNSDQIDVLGAANQRAGRKRLALAFANAINRAHDRCVAQFRPFQAVRMMKLAQAARQLSLGKWLDDSHHNFFDEDVMLARYKQAFRFELQVESSKIDYKPKGGGSFVASVNSDKCAIEAKSYDYSDPDNLQRLTVGKSGKLFSDYWDLLDPDHRISPVLADGNLRAIRLSIWPRYAREAVQWGCPKGLTWNDPTDPDMELVFEATDPVQKMRIETGVGGPVFQSILPQVGSMNWYGQFRAFHAKQLVNENDDSGQAHLLVPKIEGKENWEYVAQKLFAFAEFHGPPRYATQLAGQATEDTVLKLFHAPNTFEDLGSLVR